MRRKSRTREMIKNSATEFVKKESPFGFGCLACFIFVTRDKVQTGPSEATSFHLVLNLLPAQVSLLALRNNSLDLRILP